MSEPTVGEELSPPVEEQYRELDAVVNSAIFQRSPSVLRMFEFIVRKYKQGEASDLKEYTIAVDALGRPATFDPKQDSIVRVEAYRVRKKLKEFYGGEGADHKWEVVLELGQYVPKFQRRQCAISGGEPVPDTAASVEMSEPVGEAALGKGSRRKWLVAATAIAAACLIAGAIYWLHRSRELASFVAEGKEIRIAVGAYGPQVNQLGQVWQPDVYFSGGDRHELPKPEHPFDAALGLSGSERTGDFDYTIPLDRGVYELHLYFSPSAGERTRRFQITANGAVLQDERSPENAESLPNHVFIRVFKDIGPARDGKLHLSFRAGEDVPFLSGIALAPSRRGKMNPIRILMTQASYTTKDGVFWGPDRYEQGGTLVNRSVAVSGLDPNLFTGERYGDFRYLIPVAQGRYRLSLFFAETWFGPGNPGGGGENSRKFDVDANGVTLLSDFDVFEQAGGPRIGIERSFRGLTPDRTGYIAVAFHTKVNNAMLNALQLVEDTD